MGYDVAEAMAAGVWLLGNGPYLAGIILWYVPRNCLMRLKDMVLMQSNVSVGWDRLVGRQNSA